MCKATNTITPQKAVAASKRRRVRFGKVSAKVFHQTLTRSDKKTIWYTGSDYKAMNKEVQYNLKYELYYGFDPNDTERSWRGLEHIREGIPNVKLERRRNFVRSFLHFHKTVGIKDPNELGALAASHSNEDQVRAQYFAEYDAYEASRVYYEPEKCYYDWTPSASFDDAFDDASEQAEHYKEFCNIPRSTCPRQHKNIIMATSA